MTRDEILNIISERMGDAIWIIALLKKQDKPINKERLKDMTNELYQQTQKTNDKLITSRHRLDVMTARLEGAGIVDVDVVGRAHFYSLSSLGREVIEYKRQGVK